MPLFVMLSEYQKITEAIKKKINQKISEEVSPRHKPDDICVISEIPRTLTRKKMEIPIRKILSGIPVEKAASLDAMSNPESNKYFVKLAHAVKDKIQIQN